MTIPTSGEISFSDFYLDAPTASGEFPVDNPNLVWVLDPMTMDSSVNNVINNSSVGFINSNYHDYDTPLDTGGWATWSQAGGSWVAGSGLVPPHLDFTTASRFFTSINSLFEQGMTPAVGFTWWLIFHSPSQSGSYKRFFHYGGGSAMNAEGYGFQNVSDEYSQLSNYLYANNTYYYRYYQGGTSGTSYYYSTEAPFGVGILIVAKKTGGTNWASGQYTTNTNYGYYPSSPILANNPTWSTASTSNGQYAYVKSSGTARPQFAYTGYSQTFNLKYFHAGFASRWYDETERNDLLEWLNTRYFAGVTY